MPQRLLQHATNSFESHYFLIHRDLRAANFAMDEYEEVASDAEGRQKLTGVYESPIG
jgi:hypothetical protein